MSIELILVKDGNRFAPADPSSDEMMNGIKQGEVLTATLRRPRNVKHHRLFFALINAVFENQDKYPTRRDLIIDLKIATGLVERGFTKDGIPWIAPKSISFAAMDQSTFKEWFDRALLYMVTNVIPGLGKEELEMQINMMLN